MSTANRLEDFTVALRPERQVMPGICSILMDLWTTWTSSEDRQSDTTSTTTTSPTTISRRPLKIFRPFLGPWASRAMPAKLRDLSGRIEPLYQERMRILRDQLTEKDSKPQGLIQRMVGSIKNLREKGDSSSSLCRW